MTLSESTSSARPKGLGKAGIGAGAKHVKVVLQVVCPGVHYRTKGGYATSNTRPLRGGLVAAIQLT